jgi:membrane protein
MLANSTVGKSLSAEAKNFLQKLFKDDLTTSSAAIAYYALLSLAPLSVGALLIWSLFPLSASDDLLSHVSAYLGTQASEAMRLVLEKAQKPNLRAWAGILTIASIVAFGTTVFSQLQTTLDRIWKNQEATFVRNWVHQRIFSVILFFGLIIFLFVSVIASSIVGNLERFIGSAIRPLTFIFSWSLFAGGVTVLYRWLSRKRIAWRACWFSAVFVTILFAIGKQLFEIYVKNAAVGSAYGAAGSLIVFPLWIFYSSLIFLVGAELADMLQSRSWEWLEQKWLALHKKWKLSKHRRLYVTLTIFILACVAIRIALPFVIQNEINRRLAQGDTFRGHVESVHLAILRGAAELRDIELIRHPGKDIHAHVKSAQMNLSWLSLLKREIRFKAHIIEPNVTVLLPPSVTAVAERKKIEEKKPPTKKWQEAKADLSRFWPTFIDDFSIRSLNVKIQSTELKETPPVQILDFNLDATNIWNRVEKQNGPSNVNFSGATTGHGVLNGSIWLSAFSPTPNLRAQISLREMDLRAFNPFFRKVGNFDLKSGTLDLASEFASKNWQIDGYMKPILKNVNFIDVKRDNPKGFWRELWERLLQKTTDALKNEKTDDLAGKIRFSGRLDDPKTSPWDALVSILRNAFVRALSAGFDRDLKIQPTFPSKK